VVLVGDVALSIVGGASFGDEIPVEVVGVVGDV
jgi:hypothetical protein